MRRERKSASRRDSHPVLMTVSSRIARLGAGPYAHPAGGGRDQDGTCHPARPGTGGLRGRCCRRRRGGVVPGHGVGEAVDLSAREFALLEYLMRNAGEVVSRTRILDHVWDYNYDGLSNVVDVYVGYLRRKLGRPSNGGEPFIRTVRGVGYVVGS